MATGVTAPSAAVQARAIAVLGWTPDDWRPVFGGYTPAARYVVAAGARRAFVKIATNPITRQMLRGEARAYEVLGGPFIPAFHGWSDDPISPLLVIEDLSGAVWPPPWTPWRIDLVVEAAAALHATSAALPTLSQAALHKFSGWSAVAADPAPFASLGLASAEWIEHALPALVEAEAACPTDAASVAHFDLRSDNICFTDAGAKFVDWAGACLGDPDLDLGGWLPSLELEGGPAPETILPGRPEVAAWVSGYFAARAGLPAIPHAQLTTALPWAARALGLPPP
jgi:hypothetical protein